MQGEDATQEESYQIRIEFETEGTEYSHALAHQVNEVENAQRDRGQVDMNIKEEDYKKLDYEVLNFEPKSALFANDNGLEFYKKIIKNAAKYVNFGGYIAFECAKSQARDICPLLERNGFQVSDVIKDLAGIDRVVAARIVIIWEKF